jgi:hypothetical protein
MKVGEKCGVGIKSYLFHLFSEYLGVLYSFCK